MHKLAVLLFASATPLAAATITVDPGADAQERLQTALIDAKPGDRVQLAAGRYALGGGLSLDVKGVTVAGAGADKTVLDFTGQKGEGEGLLVTSSDVLLRDFAVENAKGNGIKSKGSDGISFVNLRVEWTGGPKATNGAYGVYPVSSSHVLIDNVYVKGASDAGIYVGQSKQIVVRNSRAEGNVAGIEIENSYNADVHHNVATGNTGGILVFDLPDLPQQGGHSIRLFQNRVIANNHPNFAAPGNIVASVPPGTGVMVMANRNVHLFDNDIKDNGGNAVVIAAYRSAFTDKNYNPLPRSIAVHGNRFAGNGSAPKFPGGAEIAAAVGGTLPPVMWDGVTAFAVPGGASATADGGMFINDGPVLNLNLKTQGTPTSAAKPEVAAALAMATIPEPARVVLPAAQGSPSQRAVRGLAGLAAFVLLGATSAPGVDGVRLLADDPAPVLSAYGLFSDVAGRVPAPGVTRYTLNTPLFSDYAEKFRYVWMPAGTRATYTPKGVLEFPVGTAIVKTFAYPADFRNPDKNVRAIETRLLVRRASGWVPLSYVWNEGQTEAVFKRAGARLPVSFIDAKGAPQQIDYAVPNTNQCKQCHLDGEAVTPIGPTAGNLNGDLNGANQLVAWAKSGKLTGLPATPPKLARWDDATIPVATRARAYLDVNCGHCHSRSGFASNSGLYLQHDEPGPAHQGINKRPVAAGRGSGGRQFAIAPGDPAASILVHRMESNEPGVMMPQFGRSVPHAEGVASVRAYIEALK